MERPLVIATASTIGLVHPPDQQEARCDLDSHADTCVGGSNTTLLGPIQRTIDVSAFAPSYGTQTLPIATVGTVWTNSETGIDYLLVIHNAIYMGSDMKNTLLNPNQMRSNGLRVDDCPTCFDPRSTHSITTQDKAIRIPLQLHGIISAFDSRKPTQDDIANLERITLTGTAPWNPYAMQLPEDTPLAASQVKTEWTPLDQERFISALHINSLIPLDVIQGDDDEFHKRLISSVNVTDDICLKQEISTVTTTDSPQALGEDILFQPMPEDPPKVAAISTAKPKSVITPEELSRKWNIGIKTAKRTLQVTTQAGLRNIYLPTDRKVRLKAPWLKFPSIKKRIFADALFSKVPSIHKDTGAVVFTDGENFDSFYPFKTKAAYPERLMSFIHDFGVPTTLTTDGASEMQRGKGREIANEYRMNLKVTVPYSPWQNKAEMAVREIKVATRRKIKQRNAPLRLWSYCGKWMSGIRRLTATDLPSLEGRTPHERVLGSTPNITPYIMFDWYDFVRFHQPVAGYPHQKWEIGRIIGVADNCTDELSYMVLPKSGRPMVRKSVWAIPPDQYNTDAMQADMIELDKSINDMFGDQTLNLNAAGSVQNTELQDVPSIEDFPPPPPDLFEGDERDILETVEDEDSKPTEADLFTPEAMDEYLSAELLMPHGEGMKRARVVSRHKDEDGNPIGRRHPNPILDSRLYDIEFPDGSTEVVATNLIAENLYAMTDDEGYTHQILEEIVGHQFTDEAIPEEESWITLANGQQRPVWTTKGCNLRVRFTDGSHDWIPLKDLKMSNPIETAEYAVSHNLKSKPCFRWWVKHTLRKRDRMISKVKSRYWKTTHKFGIELPHSVKEALAIDARTNTTFWADAIAKEMRNVGIAFELTEDGQPPVGHKEIKCHMVFDIKRDLTRKARFVAGGHLTDPPKESVFSSVVTRDSVRIAFVYAALNDLDILAADVQNAYLNAPTKERCWFRAGLEFGPDNVDRPVRIVRALYGLKSSGARWHDTFAATLRTAGFEACWADPDVWMRKARKPDGTPYWEYILCYVDDVLVISHDPNAVMNFLSGHYTLKKDSVKPPDDYLGAKIKQYSVPGMSSPVWSASSDAYVKSAVADVERELGYINQKLRNKVSTPFSSEYRPELDQSPALDAKRANYFQGLIGVLRWAIELGRIDIMVPVSMLSRYLANPRVGHLEETFHIFAYLKSHEKSKIVFDPATPVFDESRFTQKDWSQFYPDAHEPVPPRAPELLGDPMTMTCFVDADHAGCRETRRSHTGIIIFLQKAPIIWYSKRQNTVESSSFGSEFVAMKTAIEQIEGLRYKCRMMGIPLDGPTNVFCDNESVFKNSTRPESTLKKKHNAIAYHRTREAVASGIVRLAKEDGRFNLADVLTKLMPGPKLKQLISCILG